MPELIAAGRVAPAGLAVYERRDETKSKAYSYEQRFASRFSADDAKRFRADRKAWAFFARQPPGYRRMTTFWVTSAKREETRRKRLDALIERSAKGERFEAMAPAKKG